MQFSPPKRKGYLSRPPLPDNAHVGVAVYKKTPIDIGEPISLETVERIPQFVHIASVSASL